MCLKIWVHYLYKVINDVFPIPEASSESCNMNFNTCLSCGWKETPFKYLTTFWIGIPILNASLLQDAQSEHLQGLGPSQWLISTFRNGGLQHISSEAPKTERRTSAARSEPRRAPRPPVTEPCSCGCWRGTPEQGINPITPPPASKLTHFRLFSNLSLFGSSWLVLSVFNAS